MTTRDSAGTIPGLYSSPWPAEYGGPRRQGLSPRPGLGLADGERLVLHTRPSDAWNIMFLLRAPGEVYLLGSSRLGATQGVGFVERVDPVTLETITRTELPTGGHIWPGAGIAHVNGDLYVANGCYVHRLDHNGRVLAERALPTDRPHNGLHVMPDGNLVAKNIGLGDYPAVLTVLEPQRLGVVAEVVVPEPSLGRIASDPQPDGSSLVYVPATEHLLRYRYHDGVLDLDPTWQPRYRERDDEQQGLAWGGCLEADNFWVMDNGDTTSVRAIHAAHPSGTGPFTIPEAAWSGSQRLLRISTIDPDDREELRPFDAPRGWITAPPVYVTDHHLALAFDTANGLIAGIDWQRGAPMHVRWQRALHLWMPPFVMADTGEVVTNDLTGDGDHLVLLDLATGAERSRVATGSSSASATFLSPGWHRDLYYCGTGIVGRLSVT